MAYRVLVVDDHPLMLEIMRAVLAKALDDPEVHCASGLGEALEHVRGAGLPDLTVLDLGLPGCKGIGSFTRYRKAFPSAQVVVLSINDSPYVVKAVLHAGARGYLFKSMTLPLMQAALRLVAAGGIYVPPEALLAQPPELGLSDRELEVLRHIARGLNNGKIADQLDISPNTVKQHVRAVFSALGVSTRAEAIVAAEQLGFVYDH